MNNNINNLDDVSLINSACEIISDNLGESVAEKYRIFYGTKNKEDIINSLEELLMELVGKESAKKQIKIKFNL